MRKRRKSLKLIVVVVLVLALLATVGGNFAADSAVRVAVETAGTRALSVAVDLETAKLGIMDGLLGMHNLTVANPPGYQNDLLLTLREGSVRIQTKTLLSDTVQIDEVRLDGMHVLVEQNGLSNNLEDVIKTAQRRAEETPSGRKLYIKTLELTHVTVNVKLLPHAGQMDTVTLELAPIRMTDLGKNERLDIATLTAKIILVVAARIARQGTDVLPDEMVDELTFVLDTAIDLGRVIFGAGQDTNDITQKGIEGITEGLKGILKPKSDK